MLDELDRAEVGDLIRRALLDHDQKFQHLCNVEIPELAERVRKLEKELADHFPTPR
jgi:hypothetical protein